MIDTVRLRVSLSPMFSWGNPTQRPNGCGATHDQRAFVVSAVVNRLPLRTHKEKNALRAGPGAFTVAPAATGFLSSATDERPFVGATVSQPSPSRKGIRRVKESEAMSTIRKECMMTRAPKYMCPQGHPVKRTCQELTIEPLHWFCKDCRSTYTDDDVILKSKVITQRALIEQQAKEIEDLKQLVNLKDQRCQVRGASIDVLQAEIAKLKEALEFVAGEASFLSEAEAVAKQALKEEHP